jgi:hypothetical protein
MEIALLILIVTVVGLYFLYVRRNNDMMFILLLDIEYSMTRLSKKIDDLASKIKDPKGSI